MKKMVVIALVLLFTAVSAQAANISSWDLEGRHTSSVGVSGSADHVTGFSMVRGPALTVYNNYKGFYSSGWSTRTENDYVEFGFSVEDGYEVTLNYLLIGVGSNNSAPDTAGFYTSLDNFQDPVATVRQSGESSKYLSINLSGLGSITGDFTMHLTAIGNMTVYGNDYSNTVAGPLGIVDTWNSTSGYVDVYFDGEVTELAPVPLPGAVWLLLSGAAALMGCRKWVRG